MKKLIEVGILSLSICLGSFANANNCITEIEELSPDQYTCEAVAEALAPRNGLRFASYEEEQMYTLAAYDWSCKTRDQVAGLIGHGAGLVSVAIAVGGICATIATGGAALPVSLQVVGVTGVVSGYVANFIIADLPCNNSTVEEAERKKFESRVCDVLKKAYGYSVCNSDEEVNQCVEDIMDPYLRKIIGQEA